jgi:hypothetical protein
VEDHDPDRCEGAYCSTSEVDGIRFTTSGAYNQSGRHYLHDDAGAMRTELWRSDGGRIDARSIDLSIGGSWRRTGAEPFVPTSPDWTAWDPDFEAWATSGAFPTEDFFWIRGYRSGHLVAEAAFNRFRGVFSFDASFEDLDYLEFELSDLAATSYYQPSDQTAPGTLWCANWCTGAVARSLTYDPRAAPALAPVPLPGGVPLGLAGLAALLGLRWRASRTRRDRVSFRRSGTRATAPAVRGPNPQGHRR